MSNYTFVFDTVSCHAQELSFMYRYEDDASNTIGTFTERYLLPVSLDMQDPSIRYILHIMHLVVGISYYKSLLGQVQHPYPLNPIEADYLNQIYDNGLGEYTFVNQITGSITPFFATSTHPSNPVVATRGNGAVLGIGGGKDSIVTAEIMKALHIDTTVLGVATRNNHGQAGTVMGITALPQLGVERYVDIAAITALNQTYDGKNGHVPLSVILAWVGIVLAAATNRKYVLMANEAATSSGNVQWNGREINHQWAKSYEAEALTQSFVRAHVCADMWYFSPIRPYSSLAVMDLFAASAHAYFDDFTSCNLVLRIDPAARPNGRWCTQCAKCLSTWLLLSAWLSQDQLMGMFGKDLFQDASLRPTLEALLGLSGHKPLDCVGTTEELRAVTRKAIKANANAPLLGGIHAAAIPGPSIQELISTRSPANIPPELAEPISTYVDSRLSTDV